MLFCTKYVVTDLFILTLVAALPLQNEHEELVKCTAETTCLLDSCNRTSAEILQLLDNSVNPCDDFYNFACGGYFKNNDIPDDQTQISQLYDITNVVYDQLYNALKEPIAENEPKSSKLVKKLFGVCSDLETIEQNSINHAKMLIGDLGGWPVVDGENWREDTFDWKNLTYKLRKYGLSTSQIINTRVEQNIKNSTRHIFVVDQSSLPLNRINLLKSFNNTVVMEYYKYLVDLAVIFGANKESATVEFEDIFELLFEIGKSTLPPEELRNITVLTNIMTISELKQKVPSIDWVDFINNIIAIPEIKVTEFDLVDVGVPKFLTDLEIILKKTSKRVLANYIMTISIASIGHTLNREVGNLENLLTQHLFGTKSTTPRWKECTSIAMEKLKIATAALYSRKYFNEESKKNVVSIASNLHTQFLNMLGHVEWMDSNTKKKALEKAKAIEFHVAYPQELLDDKILEKHYEKLTSSNIYMQYILDIQKFAFDNMYKSLTNPVDKSDWKEHSVSHDVNAYYHFNENSIILPAGILQGAMFGNDRPNYMNYAGIGFVIGHEMTHGFDDTGKQISKEGQLENWWSQETEKSYLGKTQCIIDQYSAYQSKPVKLNLNGIITQGENIADNGGIKIAYDAYQEWIKINGPEDCLPNLSYTPNQLFWISLANAWCAKERNEQLRSTILTKSHPPSMFRIYGVIANSEKFVKDFNCPVESKMNAPKKCAFW